MKRVVLHPAPLLALLVLIAVPSAVFGQQEPRRAQIAAPFSPSLCDVQPASRVVEDVRSRMRTMGLDDGATTISRTRSGLQLVALVDDGVVLDYAVVDAEGRAITSFSTSTTAAGDTVCWKCGKDAGGTIHCWQIDCPVIVSNEPTQGD